MNAPVPKRRTPIIAVALLLLAVGATVSVIRIRAAIERGDDADQARIAIDIPGARIALGDAPPVHDRLVFDTRPIDPTWQPGPPWTRGWEIATLREWLEGIAPDLTDAAPYGGWTFRTETDAIGTFRATRTDGTPVLGVLVTVEDAGAWFGTIVRLEFDPPLPPDHTRQLSFEGSAVRTWWERWRGVPRLRTTITLDPEESSP